MLEDAVDAASARALVEGGAEFVELFGVAGGDHFDVSVVGVADASAQAEFGGLAVHEPAEAYALNAALHEEVTDLDREIGRLTGGCGHIVKCRIAAGSGANGVKLQVGHVLRINQACITNGSYSTTFTA